MSEDILGIIEIIAMIGVVIGVLCELYHFWHKNKPAFFYVIGFIAIACILAHFIG